MDDVTSFLPYLMPAVAARLDQPEPVESAEEVRLLLVKALTRFVVLTKSGFSPYVEDAVRVLQRTFLDPFPDLKKVHDRMSGTVECSRNLTWAFPRNRATLSWNSARTVRGPSPSMGRPSLKP